MMTAGPVRKSFVGGLHLLCGEEGNDSEKHRIHAIGTCCVARIVYLSRCQVKTIKGRSQCKAKYFIYEQKVGE